MSIEGGQATDALQMINDLTSLVYALANNFANRPLSNFSTFHKPCSSGLDFDMSTLDSNNHRLLDNSWDTNIPSAFIDP